ncbi:uncharacterized protein BKCO1_8600016 [Diplodia corticola]|uniref:Uncharacterized protein n=1 Tax=Diplodia corticola TaxID=236234 RepID=A0A1J9RL74_9PEZI|nr:uncharacterized protein BKCO1_8600016 [Diplodia corticola]OJD29255.1 hypothetical protein BKCO1_8600016 [Diplodia corticola]
MFPITFLPLLLAVTSTVYLPLITRRPPSLSSPAHTIFLLIAMAFGLGLVRFLRSVLANAGVSFARYLTDEVKSRLFSPCAPLELVPLHVTRYRTRTEPPSPPSSPSSRPAPPSPPAKPTRDTAPPTPFMTGSGILKTPGRRPSTPARKSRVAFSSSVELHEFSPLPKSILRPTRSSHFNPPEWADDIVPPAVEEAAKKWSTRLQVNMGPKRALRFDPTPRVKFIPCLREEKWRGALMDEVEAFDKSWLKPVTRRDEDGDVEME